MPKKTIRVAHISDTHLYSTPHKTLLGVNTQESFNAVSQLLKNDPIKPELIVVTGDLSQDGSRDSYQRLADELNSFGVPVYCVPGNHDDLNVMQQVYPQKQVSLQKHIKIGPWQLILIDSQKEGAVEGFLKTTELDFMSECLDANPNHFAIIMQHHQPVSVNSQWIDKLGVINA